MKYILLIGASNAGKSTTVNEVCKRLHPDKVWKLEPTPDPINSSFAEVAIDSSIQNGTYLMKVKGEMILVVAGSPTEQHITITVLVSICIKLEIELKLLIVSMRTFEKKAGFDTRNELQKLGEKIYEEKLRYIDDQKFEESKEWNDRIERIVNIVKQRR